MRKRPITLSGKTVLLTGATRGIGRAILDRLISEGARVVAVARDASALEALHQEKGDAIIPLAYDIGTAEARREMIAAAIEATGGIDGLINNAGVQTEMNFFTDGAEDFAPVLSDEVEINLTAPLSLSALILPHLTTRPEGFLVNITSGLAIAPKEPSPVYCATKAGLRSFTTALRYQAETAETNVWIIDVIMTIVDTDMTKGRGSGKISPQRAAEETVNGIKAGKPEIWIDKTRFLPVLQRIAPGLVRKTLR